MAKYFMLWEIDTSKVPVNAKERGVAWTAMVNMIKQDIKEGKITDWGCFAAETNGYAVSTQTDLELAKNLQRFYPFATFKVHQVVGIDQVAEIAKFLSG
jgi:hypothetical protein